MFRFLKSGEALIDRIDLTSADSAFRLRKGGQITSPEKPTSEEPKKPTEPEEKP